MSNDFTLLPKKLTLKEIANRTSEPLLTIRAAVRPEREGTDRFLVTTYETRNGKTYRVAAIEEADRWHAARLK